MPFDLEIAAAGNDDEALRNSKGRPGEERPSALQIRRNVDPLVDAFAVLGEVEAFDFFVFGDA